MDEILRQLPADSFVLDLGARKGSFAADLTKARPIRLDRDPSQLGGELVVCADAAQLPFPDRFFTGIIANHSLEHFENLQASLKEIGRVIRSDGALFISVPDVTTFTDRLYRWLAPAGGHINPFTSAADLAKLVERETGLAHMATKTLCSSLSFLNRRNAPRPLPRRLMLLGNGSEWSLFSYVWISRMVDRLFGWRSSVYGWGLYFGHVPGAIDTTTHLNGCVRCGSGSSAEVLQQMGGIHSNALGMKVYRCPDCSARNPYIT